MTTLAILTPIDPGTGNRVTVRVCSSQDDAATGADNAIWWPAIVEQPVLSMSLFDGDFTGAVEPAAANMALRLDVLRNSGQFARVERYDWSGAGASIYRLVGGAPVLLAEMRVERFAAEDDALALSMSVDTEWAEVDILFNEYAGTTGAEGGADLKGQPKPWAFGRCLNVEPVFIDQIDNVFQVSGYGPVQAISAVYERGASFGASVGNFANYAALVAADIPEGRWGTCLAEGMFRLGAPPAGVITCDVDGDNTGGFLRRTGAVVKEIASRLGLSAKINSASLDALDVAVARNVNFYINQQITLLDFARQVAAPCNAVAGIALDGRLITPRVAFGSEEMVLDAQGRQMPPVLGMARRNTSPPYKRIQMGAARSWRVHTFDEIAFFADLIDRGLYSGSEVYREGNIVETADKARWVYVNPTASAGNGPPTWPTSSNAYWSNIAPPLAPSAIGIEPGATRNVARGTYDAGVTYSRGDEVIFSGSTYRLIVDSSTGNAPPDATRWALIAEANTGPAGISVIVTNEAHVVATASDGSGGDYSSAGGQVRLLRGDTVLAPTFSIPAKSPNTAWISIDGSGNYTVSDPGVDLATATLRATLDGVNYDRTYTLARSRAGANGAPGSNGLNSAPVFIYARAASAPAAPTSNATYTFATGTLIGLNNGWSATVPAANGQPLWVRTATASSTGASDTILGGEWSGAQKLAEDGAQGPQGPQGPAGLSTAAVFIYKRSASAPTDAPADGAVYTFATGVLSGTLNGWSTSVPAANGQPLWVRQASASSTGATDTINSSEWSAVQQLVADGAAGANGGNSAVVFIYARAASAPAAPTGSTTYTFSTGVLSGTLGNGWTQSIPAANGQPLWVRTAVAFSTGTTDTIAPAEWSGASQLVQDGAQGPAGLNAAVVLIYKRSATQPTDSPANGATYTFATGALTGTLNGWSTSVPATNGNPLWVRQASASSTGATDTINASEWAAATKIVEDGAPGADGAPGGNSAVVYIYQRAASAPAAPSTTATYTFATGALTGLDNGWSATIPSGSNPLWVRTAVAFGTGSTDTIAPAEWSGASQLVQDGAPGLNSATVTLYRRSATTPTSVTVSTTYTFATGVLSGANNSWTQAIPSGTDPLWAIQATAASTGSTDTIASGEWTAPALWASPPVNNARILIYRRSPTTPALPSTSSTYTFSTGAISGLNNGWTVTVPSGTDPLWVSVASASSNGDTATIAAASWAGAELIDEPQPLGNANRVPFSLMERDQGWGVNSNPSTLSVSTSYGSTSGLRFFRATATATAANQDLSIRHSNTFPLLAGSRVSMQARLETTGGAGGAWRLALKGYNSAGTESELGAITGSGLRALTTAAAAAFVDVPANIVAGRLEFFGRSTGAGSFAIGISEPMVTSASAQQVVHPPFSPGPNALDGADVSLVVSGPVSHTFFYDAAGNLDPAGQMPRDFVFQLRTLAGQITSGVTWQYKIISGSVNGFSAGATLRAMSGSGSGTLTISSFGSNTADVEVIATTSSGSASARIALVKEFAAPNNTGGGGGGANTASQTSGFTALAAGNISFVTVSQEVQVTAGTTSGQASVNIQVAANGTTGIGGASFEVLLERWNGSSWVSEGAAVAGTAYNYTDAEGVPYNQPSAHVFSRSFTVTAGSTVRVRLRARRSGGASVGGLISGSLVLTA